MKNLKKFTIILSTLAILIGLLGPAIPSVVRAPAADPLVLQLAAADPDQTISVIVQETADSDLEGRVEALGGKISRDLGFINAFAAEMSAGSASQLAMEPGVRWVSLDAPVQQAAESTSFVTWGTQLVNIKRNRILADFNSKKISAGRTIWFTGVIKLRNDISGPVTFAFSDLVLSFSANGVQYSRKGPAGKVIVSPEAKSASTVFNQAANTWVTTVPSNYRDEIFITGIAFPVTANLPGGIRKVKLVGNFQTNDPTMTDSVDWKWAAAVYKNFPSDYAGINVKPVDGTSPNPYPNSDKAGTPENYKTSIIAGARGGGGSNYTGGYTGAKRAIFRFQKAGKMVRSALGPDKLYTYASKGVEQIRGFDAEITDGNAITKVELVLNAYANRKLSAGDDPVITITVAGQSKSQTLNHRAFDAHVKAANAGPIYLDVTGMRAWRWVDFESNLRVKINQNKLKPNHLVYYDAVGLRVTSAPGLDDSGKVKVTSLPNSAINTSNLKVAYPYVVGATAVWNEAPSYLQGQGVTVAVVDSGIGKSKDLGNRNIKSINFNESYHDSKDRYGHGTLVAGVIAGDGHRSHKAYLGIAPKTNLINVRVSDDNGVTTEADVAASLQWVYENKDKYNIRVVNLSLNSVVAQPYQTSPLCAAVEILWFNGVTVVVSAGNNGTAELFPPANDPFVITVGATNDQGTIDISDDTMASFSAYGTTESGFAKPELVAPGQNIVIYLPENNKLTIGQQHGSNRINKDYFRVSGTSFSAPMVSGAITLLLQDEPLLTPDQVKYRLMATAEKNWPGYDPLKAGAGYLNIYAAVHGTSTESANTGVDASQLLWSGNEPIVWGSVAWNSVAWNSVAWNSVAWNSVAWNSVAWNSDYWGP